MASQNEALLVAVFRQLAVTKLDYEILGQDLGLSRQAARNRWVRFQAKIMQSANSNIAAPDNGESGTPQAPRTPSPRKNKAATTKKTGSAKKRKRADSEGNDELEMNMDMERDFRREPEVGNHEDGEDREEEEEGMIDGEELW